MPQADAGSNEIASNPGTEALPLPVDAHDNAPCGECQGKAPHRCALVVAYRQASRPQQASKSVDETARSE